MQVASNLGSAAQSAGNVSQGTPTNGQKPLVPILRDLGIEVLIVAVLVVIAGISNGAANTILALVLALWLLAGIAYFTKKG